MDQFAQIEPYLRGGFFVGLLSVCLLAEWLLPRRRKSLQTAGRWVTNFGMTFISNFVVRLMEPVTAMLAAAYAIEKGWGLLNLIELPAWLAFIVAIILLDLAIYAQHVATHKIPLLWRLHKVHHSDRDIDTTTALRFHPLEIVVSMLYKVAVILLLGPAVLAVLIFEILLNGCAMFNHSNLKLPLGFDRVLRLFIVTPDMHRVHHSVRPHETNSNYGFSLSIWDRIFKTYIAQPQDGHIDMTIGLNEYQSERPARLFWSLWLPFR